MLPWIFAHLTRRTRAWAIAGGVLAFAGRLGGLATAFVFAMGQSERAAICGVLTGAVYVVRRVLATTTRVEAEYDLYREVGQALLRADVIDEPPAEPHVVLAEGLYLATELVTSSGPAFVADVFASLCALVALRWVMSAPALAATIAGAIVMGAVVVLLRRRIARLHARSVEAQQELIGAFGTLIDGRLELVASAAEASTLRAIDIAGQRYKREVKRSAMGAALLGRAPLAAAVVVIGLLVLVTGDASWASQTGSLAMLAAALPILLGATFGAHELLRVQERLRPFGAFVLRKERPELARPAREAVFSPVHAANVTFRYREDAPAILERLTREWTSGILLLRGPNGSGKSTLLRLLVGLRDPEAGQILLGATDLGTIDRALVRRHIAFLPQRPYLGEPWISVEQALALLAPPNEEALARVGLPGVMHKKIGELSVGQRQRVALARVLSRDADLLLLDEPDANLDAEGVKRLAAILEDLGKTKLVAVAAHGPIADLLTSATILEISRT